MHRSDIGSQKPIVVGVDVGGTKIAAALVDEEGHLRGCQTRPTNILSPEATLDSIAELILEILNKENIKSAEIRGIGLGIPGLVDPHRGIGIASVNLRWENVFVKDEIQKRVGLPCVIENDVKAAALGEIRYGKSKGVESLIYLNIGTGVAAAIVLNGKIHRGQHNIAGEIGHAVVDIHGPRCQCGGRGCLEALISGPAIVRKFQEKKNRSRKTSLAEFVAENHLLSPKEVYEAASAGDNAARETVDEVSRFLANAIQFLALAYDPQRIVLGGGVVYSTPLFFENLMHVIKQLSEESWVSRHLSEPDFITVTQLGKDIGILGAAALVP
ncbi:MAG: ROK family protein [Anaerolineales bacterium]|nr:ROK family protein [Anaerolineales bacterium]MCS7247461.1 ROK family protein [Anaerolineales bacterium]MDW8161272.1 ROK family protein [Anaerolineales bacterium]MDW8447076.1 ROK family protein [Anaerolineales bacterium]